MSLIKLPVFEEHRMKRFQTIAWVLTALWDAIALGVPREAALVSGLF